MKPERYEVAVVERDGKPSLFGVWDHKRRAWIEGNRDEQLMRELAVRLIEREKVA